MEEQDIIIVGGGITGLTLALSLEGAGIPCRVFEAAPELRPLGVGINLLPHGVRELTELGLQDALARVAIQPRELCFYNRFGQFIYKEPRGRFAGYDWPQFSIHRAALHEVLMAAARERLGPERIRLGRRCVAVEQDSAGATLRFTDAATGTALPPVRGRAAIGCDGIHSTLRRLLHPDEGAPSYEGINMWRGVTRAPPFLTGASMVLAGWLAVGKMVIYPIRNEPDGTQLINWVVEIQSSRNVMEDWNRAGRLEDFYSWFADWRFPWLDVAALLRKSELILEYPMIDREPLAWWSAGRVTLAGDAAHPMYPRGGNGAGQGILDARTLAGCLKREADVPAALKAYESARLKATNEVVLRNRDSSSDAVLELVHTRSGDKPFARVEDLVDPKDFAAIMENYKRIAGFQIEALRKRPSLV